MKKVDFNKLQAGDLVEVPRTQFAPMRRGWNGWLFSEAAAEGSIRVYDYDGCCIYAYYGKIRINNDGKDGKDIDVEAIGYLEGYQEHKEESGARE